MSLLIMKSKQTNNTKLLLSFISPFLSPGLQWPQEDSDIDWSMDISEAPTSPLPHVPPVSEHMSSPHVPLHNTGSNGKNRAESAAPSLLNYGEGQLAIASSWDRAHYALLIFGTEDTQTKDSEMILKSIKRIGTYIKHHPVDKTPPKGDFILVIRNLWKLIDTIYSAKWNLLIFDKEKSLTIRKCVREHIMPYYRQTNLLTLTLNMKTNTPASLPSIGITSPPTTNTSVAPPLLTRTLSLLSRRLPNL